MSVPLRSRRVLCSALHVEKNLESFNSSRQHIVRRAKSTIRHDQSPIGAPNPLNEDARTKRPQLIKGGLASSSIFPDVAPTNVPPGGEPNTEVGETRKAGAASPSRARDPHVQAAALNPKPSATIRLQQAMVMKSVRRDWRLSRDQKIKRTERELVAKSHNFPTSIKKLMLLARQIAGKTLHDALIQMRFSKKKPAVDVRAHLVQARNEAIVARGLGLGSSGELVEPKVVLIKGGKRVKVDDPTSIYIDQAWVGKGDFTISPEFRARGATNMLKHPTTHLTVVLKEEKTRVRQHEERLEKIRKRKVWVQLPNRPITAQRQYYSW